MSKDLDDCNLPKLLDTLTGMSGWENTWQPKQTSFSRSYALCCRQRPYGASRQDPDELYYALVELDGYMLTVYADSCDEDGMTFIYDSRNPDGWKLCLDLSDKIDKYAEFLQPAIDRAKIQLVKDEEYLESRNLKTIQPDSFPVVEKKVCIVSPLNSPAYSTELTFIKICQAESRLLKRGQQVERVNPVSRDVEFMSSITSLQFFAEETAEKMGCTKNDNREFELAIRATLKTIPVLEVNGLYQELTGMDKILDAETGDEVNFPTHEAYVYRSHATKSQNQKFLDDFISVAKEDTHTIELKF